jgi:hypothetical protein
MGFYTDQPSGEVMQVSWAGFQEMLAGTKTAQEVMEDNQAKYAEVTAASN